MFDSLDDQIALDDRKTISARSRWMRHGAIVAVTLAVFVALYAGILYLE